jgi:sugar lactone lactonase YvrE
VRDKAGNLFIADTFNSRVRKVSPDGIITTAAGGGFNGLGDGGPATGAQLDHPKALAMDASGNLFIADRIRIRKVSASGIITTVAGSGKEQGVLGDGGPATDAIIGPEGIAVDNAGNIFFADTSNRIRRISAAGIINKVAGVDTLRTYGFSGDGGPAVSASLNQPSGVAVDGAGNLYIYIADTQNRRIRKVSPDGVIVTVASLSASPRRLAMGDSGNLFFSDDSGVRKLAPSGIVSTLVTNSGQGYSGEGGLAGLASLASGSGVGLTVDGAGNVYVSDRSAIRVLRPVSPLDLKTGYWDVTEHIPMPAAVQTAFDQQIAAAAQYPASQRDAYIAAMKQAQQQAAKGTDSKRGVCVFSDHPVQSLLFDSQSSGQCTAQTVIFGQKFALNTACTGGNKTAESYVVERADSSHFKGSVNFTQTDASTGKVTMEMSRTENRVVLVKLLRSRHTHIAASNNLKTVNDPDPALAESVFRGRRVVEATVNHDREC